MTNAEKAIAAAQDNARKIAITYQIEQSKVIWKGGSNFIIIQNDEQKTVTV